MDEHILVIKRSSLFEKVGNWQGFKEGSLEEFQLVVSSHKEFHPRHLMESDDTYKQVIPYLVFCYKKRYFLMQRTEHSTEQRLKNSYTLGIGGHVRESDLVNDSLIGWAQREFEEEIFYHGGYQVTSAGLLNDDSSAVGRVHVGYVLILEGNSEDIVVKSELKSGMLVTLSEIEEFFEFLEPWSKILFTALKEGIE
ncbi:hypothetical protein H0X06_06830 [Candidatus Dependentiae bacterium]|nr:hypothetical protein [Candidatus Dependentiae bacterium]